MLLETLLFLLSIVLTFAFLGYWHWSQKQLNLANVMRILRSTGLHSVVVERASEQELEIYIAQKLARHFSEVRTQYKFMPQAHRRERIDIDIGKGKIGIEVKLAKLLKKSNERNRLLGQIDVYLQKHYTPANFLVLIICQPQEAEATFLQELKELISQKKCPVFLLTAR